MSKRSWLAIGAFLVSAALAAISVTAASPGVLPPLSTLEPGGFRTITQTLPVNVVFVGYEAGAGPQNVDPSKVLEALPASYDTRNRIPSFYGLPAGNGLRFEYDYNVVFARPSFEDQFFANLLAAGVDRPLTVYQQGYNTQTTRTYTIPAAAGTLVVPAPVAEQWLAEHGPEIGVDTTQYTVFLINWWGRSDFRHHVYLKSNEPDPDTGVNFGAFQSRALIAYGGTPPASGAPQRRVWFHDLSAGPEWNTVNWLLDQGDLDGNGNIDYRMPPIWEYGNTGAYRPFDDLSGDLAKVVRYVGLNLLFTTSPLYKTAISPPKLPSTIALDVNIYDGEPGVNAASFLRPQLLADRVGALQPLNTFSSRVSSRRSTGDRWTSTRALRPTSPASGSGSSASASRTSSSITRITFSSFWRGASTIRCRSSPTTPRRSRAWAAFSGLRTTTGGTARRATSLHSTIPSSAASASV